MPRMTQEQALSLKNPIARASAQQQIEQWQAPQAQVRQNIYVFNITPMGKPRMSRGDQNPKKQRPVVARYWAFKKELLTAVMQQKFHLPKYGYHIICFIPMPKSWNQAKKDSFMLMPHQQKPDKDNIEKAILDALFEDDKKVWHGTVSKFWCPTGEGKIVIKTSEQTLAQLIQEGKSAWEPTPKST